EARYPIFSSKDQQPGTSRPPLAEGPLSTADWSEPQPLYARSSNQSIGGATGGARQDFARGGRVGALSRARNGRGVGRAMGGLEEAEGAWRREAEAVLSGLKGWRLGHPRATFRELEAAVDERLNRLRARWLADLALVSRA